MSERPLVNSAGRIPVSAVILVRNEEPLIARCLASIQGVVDDVVVLDACSTDRTRDIASALGARVFEQPWLGWIAQRALGIALARHDWVFILEADEIVTPRLAASMRALLAGPLDDDDGYSVDRRDDFLGALLPRMRRRDKRLHFVRLFNRMRSRYDRALIVHDEVRVPGRAIPLDGVLLHWRGFSIVDQVARYAAYAPLEADVMASRGQRVHVASLVVRPWLRFGWCYLICGGWRLGARGLAQALMVASSEFLRHAALWERQHAPPLLHPPADVLAAFAMETPPVPTQAPLAIGPQARPRPAAAPTEGIA
jgi:(heptosyl)LPS beta-1,4-glucosyltransferase